MLHSEDLAELLLDESSRKKATPVWLVHATDEFEGLEELTEAQNNWLDNYGWTPDAGSSCFIPDAEGKLAGVVFAIDEEKGDPLQLGTLSKRLPAGTYALRGKLQYPEVGVLAWLLGLYRFDRYKSSAVDTGVALRTPKGLDRDSLLSIADSVFLGRDLINTPSNDMGPDELEQAACELAQDYEADFHVIRGEELLEKNYPMIHAVGRASVREPRLIEFTWGRKKDPLISIVGKGVCFDTGGLNIKPGGAMTLMKKDMGGAATTLTLAKMIMSAELSVRLHVIIPAVENSIDGDAFRPGDVLPSRNGMTVEIGNTDAEGRLVLADALTFAGEQKSEHLITFATLTGAARVAVGPELAPFYTTDDEFASELQAASESLGDPVWRMPFWAPYARQLKSNVADVNHISDSPFGGSITAALFLKKFVENTDSYTHFDIYGWVPANKAGKPKGGEPQAARTVFDVLEKKYPARN